MDIPKAGIEKKRDSRISRRLLENLIDEHRHWEKYLVGKLLTIIDGITADSIQRGAIKDLIKDAVFSSLNREEEIIKQYSKYLAEALKENCDWIDMITDDKHNPLID